MTPAFTFFAGIGLLILFGWYFATARPRLKRVLGSVLTVSLVALCLAALYPPSKSVRLGLDLQGGTSFLIRLIPEGDRSITPDTLDQAVEVYCNAFISLGSANRSSRHRVQIES